MYFIKGAINMNIIKTVSDNKNYKFHLFENNLLYLAYFNEAEIDLEKIIEINRKGLELVNYNPFFSIVNMRNVFGNMDNDAKKFIANNNELNNLKIIEFLLINSLPMRILTKGYLSFNKPKTETIIIKSIEQLTEILEARFPHLEGTKDLENYLKTIA